MVVLDGEMKAGFGFPLQAILIYNQCPIQTSLGYQGGVAFTSRVLSSVPGALTVDSSLFIL